MKKQSILKLSAILFACFTTVKATAQDDWQNVANAGIDNNYNTTFREAHVFKGRIFVGSGTDRGSVYTSSTGGANSWYNTFYSGSSYNINDITSTTQGGGYMYIATSGGCCDTSKVMRTADGYTWSDYFSMTNGTEISQIVPFKGLGTTDFMYLVESNANGSMIHRSAYNTNDPLNISGIWDTVFDFSATMPGAEITSATVHNGKFYFGTGNGAMLWSSIDGANWTQNASVGSGFGDAQNTAIRSLVSFGGYLYAGTVNSVGGAQIWRSNDDITWTKVQQYTTDYPQVSSLDVAANKLWASIAGNDISGMVIKSDDGLVYSTSNGNGFGVAGNDGYFASVVAFGNNVYWVGENVPAVAKVRSVAYGDGAQIWRLCTATPVTANLGPDQAICAGSNVTLNGGTGASYQWSTGWITPTISVSLPGTYSVTITGANGCSGTDEINITNLASPIITPPNIAPPGCSGSTVVINPSAISNYYAPAPSAIHKTTNQFISDVTGVVYDTINVSGLTAPTASAALFTVTIDSLYHTYSSDMWLEIVAPDGSSAMLSQNNGGEEDNTYFGTEFNLAAIQLIGNATPPYTGSFIPTSDFSTLTGSPNGAWKLRVTDGASGDDGYLKGWSIHFQTPDNTMTYSWSPSAGLSSTNTLNTTATIATSTTYSLTVTNAIGCATTLPVVASVIEIPFAQSADTVCFGYSYFLEGASANTHWSPSTFLSATTGQYITAAITSSITYYATDTVGGCPLSDSIHLFANPAFSFPSVPSSTYCHGDTAMLTVYPTGGSLPYTYQWGNTGGPGMNTQTVYIPAMTSMSYSITVRDAAGCPAYGSTSIYVTNSTDIYGKVTNSGGPVAFSNVVLYRYETYLTHYDTVQIVTTDAAGNYFFPAVDHHGYLIEAFPSAAYAGTVPTYYGNTFLWDAATIVLHDCMLNDTLNIVAAEVTTLTGPGALSGTVYEDFGFGRVPGDPVPGIDVKLGRNPGGQLIAQTETGTSGPTTGQYAFTNLPLSAPGQWYTIYVDIPGLGRDSSYNIVLDTANFEYFNLDYFVDSTVIYIQDLATGIKPVDKLNAGTFSVYPNPFKETTTIEYAISQDATVKLEVFNVLGAKMKTVTSTRQQAGTYKFTLDEGRDRLEAGMYFITLTIDGKASTQRVIVMD